MIRVDYFTHLRVRYPLSIHPSIEATEADRYRACLLPIAIKIPKPMVRNKAGCKRLIRFNSAEPDGRFQLPTLARIQTWAGQHIALNTSIFIKELNVIAFRETQLSKGPGAVLLSSVSARCNFACTVSRYGVTSSEH